MTSKLTLGDLAGYIGQVKDMLDTRFIVSPDGYEIIDRVSMRSLTIDEALRLLFGDENLG
jgi:hypothetical protein